jgi:hypothetical protein
VTLQEDAISPAFRAHVAVKAQEDVDRLSSGRAVLRDVPAVEAGYSSTAEPEGGAAEFGGRGRKGNGRGRARGALPAAGHM